MAREKFEDYYQQVAPEPDEYGRRIWHKKDGFRGGYEACPKCGGPKKVGAKQCGPCRYKDPTENFTGDGRPLPSKKPRCGATARDGSSCRNYAGFKTKHKGWGYCRFHGGNTPAGEKQALLMKADAQMREDLDRLGRPAPRTIAPEEAIQWLLDTGWLRANKWEDALAEWAQLSSAEKSTLIALSHGERKELREVAGLARKTGYRPQQHAKDMASLVYASLARALEESGLTDDPRVRRMWDSLLDSFRQAERQDEVAVTGMEGMPDPELIEGRVVSTIALDDYGSWPLRELKNEIIERDLDMPKRVKSRRDLIRVLEEDDMAEATGEPRSGTGLSGVDAGGDGQEDGSVFLRNPWEDEDEDETDSDEPLDGTERSPWPSEPRIDYREG